MPISATGSNDLAGLRAPPPNEKFAVQDTLAHQLRHLGARNGLEAAQRLHRLLPGGSSPRYPLAPVEVLDDQFCSAVWPTFLITMLDLQVGGLSEENGSCINNFAVEHPHFFELARVGTYDPSTMSEDEFVEIVENGLRIYNCMTDNELRAIQNASAHALASFGE